MLIVDRSGSMTELGTDGASKWIELSRSLLYVLPREDARISFGLTTFPIANASLIPGGNGCTPPSHIDLAPAYHNGAAILRVLGAYGPNGGTPTYEALQLAAQYFASEPDSISRRYLVLTTDGGPNCNAALSPAGCRCSGPSIACNASMNPAANLECLDDGRVVSLIRTLSTMGVHTFVVGLPGTESFSDVLNAMAVAGGEARAGSPRYFDAASTSDLIAAMNTITSALADCTFQLDLPPPDPMMVDVRLGGVRIPFDPTNRNGWDWLPGSMSTTIEFYGPACDEVRAASGGAQLVAAFGCPPLPAPP
jgi:hypothetical protein